MGLQRETVSRGVTGIYAQVLFVVVLERLLFGVIPSLLSVLGAAIIMSSALYVVVVSVHYARLLLLSFCADVDSTHQMKKQEPHQDSTADDTAT
jgi:hypothetical protein